jgi:hypothetical protein
LTGRIRISTMICYASGSASAAALSSFSVDRVWVLLAHRGISPPSARGTVME